MGSRLRNTRTGPVGPVLRQSGAGTKRPFWKFYPQPRNPDPIIPATASRDRYARRRSIGDAMRDFPDAAFAPEAVEVMVQALDASVAALPHPVTSGQVNLLAESILRTAQTGERNASTLQRMAMLELHLTERV